MRILILVTSLLLFAGCSKENDNGRYQVVQGSTTLTTGGNTEIIHSVHLVDSKTGETWMYVEDTRTGEWGWQATHKWSAPVEK